MSGDELLKHVLDDNTDLFRQRMKLMNQCQDVEERLEEAEKLLKEWKELAWSAMPISMTSIHLLNRKTELDKKTDIFLKKEGKNE